MHFAYLVRDTRIEKYALGGRGLTGINVGTDADVAIPVDGRSSWHFVQSFEQWYAFIRCS
jgi:hypothetical protein